MTQSAQRWRFRSKWFASAMLSAVLLLGCGGSSSASGENEVSANFDLENVKPFLSRVSAHVDGFGPAQIYLLLEDVAAMSGDAEKSWDFDVVHDGEPTPLQIRVFMDDVDAPDIYFFTSAKLAATINRELKSYFEELGR